MSNRETFREDPLLAELLKKLQKELRDHDGLIELNQRRYEEKIGNATSDDQGINALEDLLATDPTLADLFGSMTAGRVAAKTVTSGTGAKITEILQPYVGAEFPSYFRRSDGSTNIEIELPRGDTTRVSFLTDVKNNYFTRHKQRGKCEFQGMLEPSFHLFNGRLTFTFHVDKNLVEGTSFITAATIMDNAGHGPFKLRIKGLITAPRVPEKREPPAPNPKTDLSPSRPDVIEVMMGPDDPPIMVDRVPQTQRLQLAVNKGSRLLADAKDSHPKEEWAAVEFVFKYGLALVAMGLLDAAKKTDEWHTDEVSCRESIQKSAIGIGRIIVPLCLGLPNKIPRAA
jgi:hypothetical protein